MFGENKSLTKLEHLLNLFPNGFGNRWDYGSLACNPSVTPNLLSSESELARIITWYIRNVSYNQSITTDFLRKYKDGIDGRGWFIHGLSCNSALTADFVLEFINGFCGEEWDFKALSINKSVATQLITAYPEGINDNTWYINSALEYDNIPLEFINAHKEGINGIPWSMMILSSSNIITVEFIEENIDGLDGNYWDLSRLSKNEIITEEFVEKYIDGFCDQKWNFCSLSSNRSISMKFIKKHIIHTRYGNCSVKCYSSNPSIPISYIITHPGIKGNKWKLDEIVERDDVTYEIIHEYFGDHPDIESAIDIFSLADGKISLESIQQHYPHITDTDKIYSILSRNIHVKVDYVNKHMGLKPYEIDFVIHDFNSPVMNFCYLDIDSFDVHLMEYYPLLTLNYIVNNPEGLEISEETAMSAGNPSWRAHYSYNEEKHPHERNDEDDCIDYNDFSDSDNDQYGNDDFPMQHDEPCTWRCRIKEVNGMYFLPWNMKYLSTIDWSELTIVNTKSSRK